MSAAAITPHVKGIIICDELFGSDVATNVYDLERVRQEIVTSSFLYVGTYHLFIQLECARPGTFNGNIRIVHEGTTREVRRLPLVATFDTPGRYVGYPALASGCRFLWPGRYDIEVWFWGQSIKGERS